MADRLRLRVRDGDPSRLDHFLTGRLSDYSRSRLQKMIRAGQVTVDSVRAGKTGQVVEEGMLVEVELPPNRPAGLVPEHIPLDVIFENEALLVVNKPAGMVVHPSAGHESGTLVNAVLAHAPDIEGIGGEIRPGVVHRLDKDTSGVILLAKNERAHHELQAQFRDRSVRKRYLALVDGSPATPTGVIDAPIGRDRRNRKRMAVVPPARGRAARSVYRTLERFADHTLLEVEPETGRTHQIRVHLAYIHTPVAGDTLYGRKKRTLKIKRHFLHASALEIRIPGETGARTFEAPLPVNLSNLLADMRRKRPAVD